MATESSIRYQYSLILDRALRPGEESAADKVLAIRLGVSERQVRKARMGDGTIDAYLFDAMCTGMGIHPHVLLGFEGWIEEVDPDVLEAEAVASEKRAARKAAAS